MAWSPARGVRANASQKSHAQLDAAAELDDGDPFELASEYATLVARFPELTILGGCCGTDERHIEQIARACINSSSQGRHRLASDPATPPFR
jgi:homocysteine S-methyltransferase